MQCANYNRYGQCKETAEGRFPCCSSACGWEFKKHFGLMQDYKAGKITKRELVEGDIVKYPWTDSEFDYYQLRA